MRVSEGGKLVESARLSINSGKFNTSGLHIGRAELLVDITFGIDILVPISPSKYRRVQGITLAG